MRSLLVTAMLISMCSLSHAATLVVPDDYPTIQAAYAATGPFGGDTILLRAGTHAGGLQINKPITIVGDADAFLVRIEGGSFTVGIDGEHPNHGVQVTFMNVTLVDSGISLHYGGQYGTLVGAVIQDCVFEGSVIDFMLDCSLYLKNNLFVGGEGKTAVSILFFMGGYGNPSANILGNTVVGYSTFVDVAFSGQYSFQLENNIVASCGTALKVSQLPLPQWSSLKCNDVFNCSTPYDGIADLTGVNGNIAIDPEFCDQSTYYLQQSSPCLPGQHPAGSACGLIGYSPVVCQPVRTETRTWGQIKNLYR